MRGWLVGAVLGLMACSAEEPAATGGTGVACQVFRCDAPGVDPACCPDKPADTGPPVEDTATTGDASTTMALDDGDGDGLTTTTTAADDTRGVTSESGTTDEVTGSTGSGSETTAGESSGDSDTGTGTGTGTGTERVSP